MEIFTPPVIKEKRPTGRPPKHTAEFRMMVARKVLEEGMTYRQAGEAFGLSHGSIWDCIRLFKNGSLNAKRRAREKQHQENAPSLRQQAQIRELKHEIAELYLENLMLKKALNHSLRIKKENSSVITSENLDPSLVDAK